MQVIYTKDLLNSVLEPYRSKNLSIGLVPTMGALHEGHKSLVKKAVAANKITVVSIFVNPTQFNNPDDLEKYPRNLEQDVKKLEELNANIVIFTPAVKEIYTDEVVSQSFEFDGLEHKMEGKHRKGHFDGVGTIVKQLFEIVKPHFAYFGEKDYQQLLIIKKMVAKLQMPLTVVGCPILRESHGLAMSSRNELLAPEVRTRAAIIYRSLLKAKELFANHSPQEVLDWVTKQFEDSEISKLEYVEIAHAETLDVITQKVANEKYRIFTAVYAGEVRLIDNLALN